MYAFNAMTERMSPFMPSPVWFHAVLCAAKRGEKREPKQKER